MNSFWKFEYAVALPLMTWTEKTIKPMPYCILSSCLTDWSKRVCPKSWDHGDHQHFKYFFAVQKLQVFFDPASPTWLIFRRPSNPWIFGFHIFFFELWKLMMSKTWDHQDHHYLNIFWNFKYATALPLMSWIEKPIKPIKMYFCILSSCLID